MSDDLRMGYTDPESVGQGRLTLMTAGQHPAAIASVELLTQKNEFKKKPEDPDEVTRFKFEFHHLTVKDEEGQPHVISTWTGTNYGNPSANLTALIDQIFGRALTEDEARRLKLSSLVGVKGYVLVSPKTKKDNTKTVEFSSWITPDNRPFPKAEDFLAPAQQTATTRPAPQSPKPKGVLPEPNIPDPFAE